MQKTIFLFLCAACAALALLFFPRARIPAAAAHGLSAVVQYRCPMHPEVLREARGDCPICGMQLVPAARHEMNAAPSAGLRVAPQQQGALGIVVGAVERKAGSRTLRIPGRVVPDETRVFKVNAGIDGSIHELSPVTTGSWVRKDQVLGSFWAPAALTMIQLYILNLAGHDYVVQRKTEGSVEGQGINVGYDNLQQRTMQLSNAGVSRLQMDEMARTRKIPDTIKIVSPANGFVLSRNVTPGQKFERGAEFFRIADLRRVWILADVFAQDGLAVRPGMRARLTGPELPHGLTATVAEVLPQFDAQSRTLKVRLETDNPGYALRPDMFVDVRFDVALPEALVVPGDAVIDSGLRKTVFVETHDSVFEPREVETGWRHDGQVEITAGLAAGERIVTSGTFFLDSESRMRTTATGAAAPRTPAAPTPKGHEGIWSGGAGVSISAGEQR